MSKGFRIIEPFQFNPLKHHLVFVKDFISYYLNEKGYDEKELIRQIKHIGTSVMDVYTAKMSVAEILKEVTLFLGYECLSDHEVFARWTGKGHSDYKIISISDDSQWMLKYHDSQKRYVHLFPARLSPHTFRIKANTLKSAILYIILIGRDYVTEDDLNRARAFIGLSPVKEIADSVAVSEMIEILRT